MIDERLRVERLRFDVRVDQHDHKLQISALGQVLLDLPAAGRAGGAGATRSAVSFAATAVGSLNLLAGTGWGGLPRVS